MKLCVQIWPNSASSWCHAPAWMMSLAHSLQGNNATYMVQPFTSALFLFMMAFSSAWHTAEERSVNQVIRVQVKQWAQTDWKKKLNPGGMWTEPLELFLKTTTLCTPTYRVCMWRNGRGCFWIKPKSPTRLYRPLVAEDRMTTTAEWLEPDQ